MTINYLWIPEGTADNVVPGLDSILVYTQSKYATLTALQHAVTNMTNIIDNDIDNIQTEINNLEITNQQHISKELNHNTTHTHYTFQRNNTIHTYGNRISFITQQHYFTYQRKPNQELQIQLSNTIVADLQNQTNNINTTNLPDDNEPGIGYA